MEKIAPGLVSLNGTDLQNETLRAEQARAVQQFNEQLAALRAENNQLRKQANENYGAYTQAETARRAAETELTKRYSLDLDTFPNHRVKVTAEVGNVIQLNPKVGQQEPAVIGVDFILVPLGLIVHDAVIRWDNYSLRLHMPKRMVPCEGRSKSSFANTLTFLGDHERDFFSHTVFESLAKHLQRSGGMTVEQFGSSPAVQLPKLLWKVDGHKFIHCLRRDDALPHAEYFSVISSNYDYEKSAVLNAIAAAQASNTANDAALRQHRVIGSHGFLPDAHQRSDTYKQTF